MDVRYSFVRASICEAQAEIARLWAQGLGNLVGPVAAEKYRQYYVENPAGFGECVLLIDNASGLAVGVQGFVPRRFWLGERSAEASVLADYVVVPEHRSLGPALKLMRAGIELGKSRFAFFYGTPNEKSVAIVRRAGIATVGALTRYTKIVRSASYWRRRLPGWLVPIVALVADWAIAGVDRGDMMLTRDQLAWSEHSSFGPAFDSIWINRSPERVYGERSSAVLAWRYPSKSLSGPWIISVACDRNKRPIGYVIWRIRNGAAMVSDFLFAGPDTRLKSFMHSFAWHLRQFSVERVSLEFFGSSTVVDALRSSGFAARERQAIAYVAGERQTISLSSEGAFITSFDRDHEE